MFGLLCDRKGITLMEVLVSVVLITIGVLGLLTLMPSGWRLSGTSDALGRAAGILQAELEAQEIFIINKNNSINPIPAPGVTKTVYGGGTAPQSGDNIAYTVQTVRTALAVPSGGWLVQVQVTWPTKPLGIQESLIVRPQHYFRQ
jgi:Tfp pilus assembly protein PilV